MIVAGGLYLEACVSPGSMSLFGSGGRAALGLAGLSDAVQLHAFQPAAVANEVFPNFEPFGVEVHLHPASGRISFQYLHPLARPRIRPIPLPTAHRVTVAGQNVLRFGCLEGDFKVEAHRAIFDPQSAVAPEVFGANGSRANHLALVLNRAELRAASGAADLDAGAAALMARDNAEVVVVKCGPYGARVYTAGADPVDVSAFQTQAVYKVGSGDIFSATFAHYWAEAQRPAAEAARLASLHTADYVETRLLPVRHPPTDRPAAQSSARRSVTVAFAAGGASADWLREEVLSGLADLSVEAQSIALADLLAQAPGGAGVAAVLLVVAQVVTPKILDRLRPELAAGRRVLTYVEQASPATVTAWTRAGVQVEQDLSAILYRAAWN